MRINHDRGNKRIVSVAEGPGVSMVKTADRYIGWVHAADNGGRLPRIGDNLNDWKLRVPAIN